MGNISNLISECKLVFYFNPRLIRIRLDEAWFDYNLAATSLSPIQGSSSYVRTWLHLVSCKIADHPCLVSPTASTEPYSVNLNHDKHYDFDFSHVQELDGNKAVKQTSCLEDARFQQWNYSILANPYHNGYQLLWQDTTATIWPTICYFKIF